MNEERKKLRDSYLNREIVGGIYAINNTKRNERLVEATTDMNRSKNRFEFAQNMGSCIHKRIEQQWKEDGSDAFVFEIIETVTKKKDQTEDEFAEDVKLMYEMLIEEQK